MWHAGAAKITESANTVVRNNHSHDNFGDGWWFDTDNWGVIVKGNLFEDNTRYGVLYEASHKGDFAENVFRENGTSVKWGGAGLWLSTSKDVRVENNTFDRNVEWALALSWTDRGTSSRYGERRLANVLIRNNRFIIDSGRIGVPYGIDRIFSSANRFVDNTYKVADLKARYWRWESSDHDWKGWRGFGHDGGGSLSRISR
jgi:hypothetical protein